MTNTTTATQFVSIRAFAIAMGKAPQQLYGMNREGKIPVELIVTDLKGQPMLKLEEATQWWNERQAGKASKVTTSNVQAQQDPKLLLSMLVSWMEQTSNKKLTEDLKEVLAKMEGKE